MVSTTRNSIENKTDWSSISPDQIRAIVENKNKEIAIRDDLLKELYAEVLQLRSQLQHLQESLKNDPAQKAYKRATSWVSKIVFAIRHKNRPLRSSEIIALLEVNEPYLAAHQNKTQYFSAFMTQAVRYKRICPYKLKGVRGYYYLLPEWMNADGTIKQEFREEML